MMPSGTFRRARWVAWGLVLVVHWGCGAGPKVARNAAQSDSLDEFHDLATPIFPHSSSDNTTPLLSKRSLPTPDYSEEPLDFRLAEEEKKASVPQATPADDGIPLPLPEEDADAPPTDSDASLYPQMDKDFAPALDAEPALAEPSSTPEPSYPEKDEEPLSEPSEDAGSFQSADKHAFSLDEPREDYPSVARFHQSLYDSGNVCASGVLRDDLPDGPWNFYYPTGQLRVTVHYDRGRLDGTWTIWREDGTRETQESYRAGRRHGQWDVYDSQGEQVAAREQYQDGQRHGVWQQFFPTGKLESEQSYVANLLDGIQRAWYENGQVARQLQYRQGVRHGRQMEWNADGSLLQEVDYDDGYRPGGKDSQ